MNKVKTALFSTVPMLLSIGIQFFAVYYLLLIAAIFLFGIGPGVTGRFYDSSDLFTLISDMDFNTVAMIIFSFCCMVVFGIWYCKRCGGTLRLNFKKEIHPLELIGIVCLVPGTQYLSSLVASMVSAIFPSWLEAYEELLETAGLSGDVGTLMLIYSVFMAPISEELIFRGVTLRIAQRAFQPHLPGPTSPHFLPSQPVAGPAFFVPCHDISSHRPARSHLQDCPMSIGQNQLPQQCAQPLPPFMSGRPTPRIIFKIILPFSSLSRTCLTFRKRSFPPSNALKTGNQPIEGDIP